MIGFAIGLDSSLIAGLRVRLLGDHTDGALVRTAIADLLALLQPVQREEREKGQTDGQANLFEFEFHLVVRIDEWVIW